MAAMCKVLSLLLLAKFVWAEDASALVQSTVQAHQSASAFAALGRARLVAQIAAGQLPAPFTAKFECDKFPLLCRPPFNCQNFTMAEALKLPVQGISPDGKANLRLWCAAPHYEKYIDMCIVQKDLVAAGQIQFNWSMNQHNGVDELDGSYCFIEGHCTNTAVTNATTMEEAAQMCDERYGHKAWASFASFGSLSSIIGGIGGVVGSDMRQGFKDSSATTMFLKAACAMGNYHCDVMYCKETYCKIPHYVQKFNHLLPRIPGHLIKADTATAVQ
mmetsp:Transcript_29552/g.68730  ORF Transcript_29552/g.68730 Transcript_29552/m.68730 type:complete len:274 (+) Transcript_29552:83-904(+)